MSTKVKSGTSEGGNAGAGEGGNAGAGEGENNGQAAGQQGQSQGDEGGEAGTLDESKWDAKTAAYIKKLRSEAANGRTKNKDLESKLSAQAEKEKKLKAALGIEDEQDPAEKLKLVETEKQTLGLRNAILEMAVGNGIGADSLDFFEFMITKRTSELQDGEELTEEQLGEIVAAVKAQGTKPKATTTVDAGKGKQGGEGNPGATEVTLEKFIRMNMSEKGSLYQKNKDLYLQLAAEAKQKNRLI